MSTTKQTVLITGCSDGGLGAALAVAFHDAGLNVIATARNVSKMKDLTSRGIQTKVLDVLSDSSIRECVSSISHLDILVNNAGAGYGMPVSDISLVEAKKLFDLNVWSYLAVTQAFLPLLLKSKGVIVNQTSVASCVTTPFMSTYNASKAAMAMFSDSQRIELAPFGIRVVDLKTGMVASNFFVASTSANPSLPEGSLYASARETVEKAMNGGRTEMGDAMPADKWAKAVVRSFLKKEQPPWTIWKGTNALLVWFGTFLPHGTFDNMMKKMFGLNEVADLYRKEQNKKLV